MLSQSSGKSIAPFEDILEGHAQRRAQPLYGGEPGVVVALRVGDLLYRIVAETRHVGQLAVGKSALCSTLVALNALAQTDSQSASSFLRPLGYWQYPRLLVFSCAPNYAGRVRGSCLTACFPPARHSRQSSELLSTDTLRFEVIRGSRCDDTACRYGKVICAAARRYATQGLWGEGADTRSAYLASRSAPARRPESRGSSSKPLRLAAASFLEG